MAEDRKNRAQRRLEEREEARYKQAEADTEVLINTTPSPVTAVDGLGVERIITTVDGTYEAPQTDPDPKEVERLKNLESKLGEKKQERLDSMTSVPDGGGEVAKQAIAAESSVGTPPAEDSSSSSSSSSSDPSSSSSSDKPAPSKEK